MQENVHLLSGGLRLAGQFYCPDARRFAPPYPAIVICHGLGSRKERHGEFAESLSARGFAALAIDLRGHGESEGALDGNEVLDLEVAARYLAARPEVDASRLGVRGSSLGGYYAIQAGARFPVFRAVVAICPATGPGLRSALLEQGTPSTIDDQGLYARLRIPEYLDYLDNTDVFESVSRISPRAIFIVHARGDETIPYQVSEALYSRACEPKRLLLLEGGSHTSAQHDKKVHETVITWLRTHLG